MVYAVFQNSWVKRMGRDEGRYVRCRINNIKQECRDTRTFRLEPDEQVERVFPGQFGMFKIHDVGENPFSFSNDFDITVREVCEEDEPGESFTNHLFRMREGDWMLFRGPYGRGFPSLRGNIAAPKHPIIIIAGGCGSAPLRMLAKEIAHEKGGYKTDSPVTVLVGAKTRDELLFVEDFERYADTVDVFTDDGSYGNKGVVTDGIRKLDIDGETMFYICGKEKMMVTAAREAVNAGANPEKIYLSLERYMGCGIGLCGKCDCGGYLVCRDGPVFSYAELKENPHFGKMARAKSGRLIELS